MRKIKKLISILLILALAISMVACGGSKPAEKPADKPATPAADKPADKPAAPAANGPVKKYSFASGSVGGNFYLMGGGISTVINKYLPKQYMMTSETTGGGSANLGMLQKGDAELGIAMTSSLHEATNGTADWTKGVKHDKVRSALALYPSWLTVYTKANSGIKSLSDINGKIVGLGSKGMAMDAVLRKYFDENKIVPKQIHNDGHAATASALGDGVIDVAITFSYPPFAAIAELENTTELFFVPLKPEEQEWFTKTFTFYTKQNLPANSYKGVKEDIASVTEWNMVVSSSDVPQEDVYNMIKALCEHQDEMIAVHPSAKHMTAKNTLNSNIPLHAGTVQYLKELGIDVPKELIPAEYKDK